MTRARPKYTEPTRGLIESESAGVIGLGMTEYTRLLPRLEAEGFPKPDPLTGKRNVKAIEHWMDVRAGLVQDGNDNGLMARIEEFRNAP
ncbi:MAG: hypothetical protein O6924_09695, partial [Alphaproteobacteria bacterium]|nr:hypothetical protein [Alphaproteobacteria bacterium]